MRHENRTLESGLRLSVFHRPSSLAHIQLFVPFGGDTLSFRHPENGREVRLLPGSAHYFEHVLHIMPPLDRNGAPIRWRTPTPKTKRGARQAMTVLEENGAVDVNAYTGNDVTDYWFCTRENVNENTRIMLEYVCTAYLPQDRFRQEAGVILDEAARYEDMTVWKMLDLWNEQAFVVHGAKHPIIGTTESIPRITLENVLSLHDVFYRPSNMHLVAIGPIATDALAQCVESALGEFGKGQYRPSPQDVGYEEPAHVVVPDNFSVPLSRSDISRPYILGGWKALVDTSLDPQERVRRYACTELAAQALFGKGSFTRERLVRNGMDERTFGGDCEAFRDWQRTAVWGDADEPERFRRRVLDAVEEKIVHGISAEELRYARGAVLAHEDALRGELAMWAERLERFGTLTGDPADYFAYLSRLETITAAEVNAQLPNLFQPEAATFVLAVPERHGG